LPPAKPDLLKAARSDLRIVAHPDEFGGLTDTHADTVARQLLLEDKSIDQVGTNPDAGRASNDLTLGIIAHCTGRKALFEYEKSP
jgi:hypothetical protein